MALQQHKLSGFSDNNETWRKIFYEKTTSVYLLGQIPPVICERLPDVLSSLAAELYRRFDMQIKIQPSPIASMPFAIPTSLQNFYRRLDFSLMFEPSLIS